MMKISTQTTIEASQQRVWNVITDIDSTPETLSGVNDIEILHRPESGLKGLKWKETREMYSKEATETMWISDEEPPSWYEVTSLSHGVEYRTRLSIEEVEGDTVLRMEFEGTPKTIGAKIMSIVVLLFRSATKKALEQDLADIKTAAESHS